MIVNTHPIVEALNASPWRCHLVGSRYVGVFDRDKSDYDFIVECESTEWTSWREESGSLREWLEKTGFCPEGPGLGYGPDRRLHGTCVWKWTGDGWPDVDVLPMTPAEARMRLAWFAAMKALGDKRGGLLALTLKKERQWATLWECLAAVRTNDNEADAPGGEGE